MAMREKTKKGISKPPAPAKEPLIDSLEARKQEIREDIRKSIAGLIEYSAENIMIVGYLLSDGDGDVRTGAAKFLVDAASRKLDISYVIEALGKAFSDDDNPIFRYNAASSLGRAAENGADISASFEALIHGVYDGDLDLRETIVNAFRNAAEKGNRQTREKIISVIIDFMNSECFLSEANSNTRKYLQMMSDFDEILKYIEIAEREAA